MKKVLKRSDTPKEFDYVEAVDHCNHFLIHIPAEKDETKVSLKEYKKVDNRGKALVIAEIDLVVFREIYLEIESAFRERHQLLAKNAAFKELKAGQKLSRMLGRELAVLFWALEGVTPEVALRIVANWRPLVKDYLWWMYSLANTPVAPASTTAGLGWKKALQVGLAATYA